MAKKSKGVSSSFKKSNFDRSIRVSESTIQGLREGKTFQGNVTKFKATGMTTEQREAMNRFYGKKRVAKAFGSTDTSPRANSAVSAPKAPKYSGGPKAVTSGGNGGGAKSMAPTVRKSSSNSFAKGALSFVSNELLGVDDVKNVGMHLRKRQFRSAAKSAAEGAFEVGTTAAAILAAAPTGGGSLAARGAMVAARQGAKQVAKQGAKQTAKSAAKTTAKTAAKGVKAVATGSPVAGVKAVGRGTKAAYRGSKGAVKKLEAKSPEVKTATRAAAASSKAKAEMVAARKAYNATKAAPGGRAKPGVSAAYDARKAAVVTARQRANAARSAEKRVAAARAERAARVAKKKLVRKGARRAVVVRGTGAANTYYNQ